MAVELEDLETRDHVVLVWTSNRLGDVVPNTTGVEVEHVTQIVSGSVDVKIRGTDRVLSLVAGEEIRIPVKTPYAFRTTSSATEVRCLYPKLNAKAVADIGHLRERRKRIVSEGTTSIDVIDTAELRNAEVKKR